MHLRAPKACLLAMVCLCAAPFAGCARSAGRPWRPLAMFGKHEEAGPQVQTPADRMDALRELADRAPQLPAAEQERASLELAQAIPREEDTLVRTQMFRSMASLPTTTADTVLAAGLNDPDREVRIACCQGWGSRGGPEAVRLLAEVLGNDTDIDVRLAAARALGSSHDPQAAQALGLALEDPDPAMQHRAVVSLREVTGQDFGNDVNAWREYTRGGTPRPPSLIARVRNWF